MSLGVSFSLPPPVLPPAVHFTGNNPPKPRENDDTDSQEAAHRTTSSTPAADAELSSDADPDESRPAAAGDTQRRPVTQQPTSRGRDGLYGPGGGAPERDTRTAPTSARPDGDAKGDGRGGRGAAGVLSSVEVGRPSTAPMHSDGKVIMRPLGRVAGAGGGHGGGEGGGQDPPSVVFEPGFSRLRTRRVILDRRVVK